MNESVTITIPKDQAKELLMWQEYWIFDTIRNDPEVDNIRWLRLQLDTYDNIAHAIDFDDTRGK